MHKQMMLGGSAKLLIVQRGPFAARQRAERGIGLLATKFFVISRALHQSILLIISRQVVCLMP
jgi:hypothetical protein